MTLLQRYKKIFRIEEIEKNVVNQWMMGASLFFFFLTFQRWLSNGHLTRESIRSGIDVCWPYFQECASLYVLQGLPYHYSLTTFYMGLFGAMLLVAYFMWRKSWDYAHLTLVPLFIFKSVAVFVLSYGIAGPYDYYHLILTAILLFAPFKEYFMKLAFVLLYFLAATTKFDASWTLGTYFSTLQPGLPLFPDALIPLLTNLVIGMQVIGAWFLLSKNMLVQRTALFFFVTFHLYSGIFVHFHYPAVSLPPLLILFGPMYRFMPPPFSRRTLLGWFFMLAIFLFEVPPWLIEGDRRLTLEGNRYGMFMFEANHQCIIRSRTYFADAETPLPSTFQAQPRSCTSQRCLRERTGYIEGSEAVHDETWEIGAAWNRCDPYMEMKRLQRRCTEGVSRIAFTMDHSVSGQPFLRIVDTADACTLTYKPFTHNEWITLPPHAPVLGYPLKNEFRY